MCSNNSKNASVPIPNVRTIRKAPSNGVWRAQLLCSRKYDAKVSTGGLSVFKTPLRRTADVSGRRRNDTAWRRRRRRRTQRCASQYTSSPPAGSTYTVAPGAADPIRCAAGDMDQLLIVKLARNTVLPLTYVVTAALLVIAGYFLALKTQVSIAHAAGPKRGGEGIRSRGADRDYII